MKNIVFYIRIIALVPVFCICSAMAGQWENWRGPSYNGSSPELNLPERWGQDGNICWKTELPGPGASTPIISGGNVYVTAEVGAERQLTAICIDEISGNVRWKHVLGRGRDALRNNMASPSPVTDGKVVFFVFGTGDVSAVGREGKILWQVNLEKMYGENRIDFAYSSSPVLVDGKLCLQVLRRDPGREYSTEAEPARAGYLVALDPASGRLLWKRERPVNADIESQEAYSTPIPCRGRKGKTELVVAGGDCVTGHDPASGKELWRWTGYNEKRNERFRVITSPVPVEGVVIVSAPRHTAVYALRSGQRGKVEYGDVLWRLEGGPDATTPLVHEDILYVLDGDRRYMAALDAWSGNKYWQGALPGNTVYRASPTAGDGKIYCISEGGDVSVLKAGKEFEILFTCSMGEGGKNDWCRSSIALADSHIYIRTSKYIYRIGK